MDQPYCEVKSRQILPPDRMCCPVPRGAIFHKTLNEQRNLASPNWRDDCTEPAGTSGGATVVQVASEPTIHAQSHNLPRHPRSADADRAPSPFESLLDDSAPAADRSAPPPDDKASRADDCQSVRIADRSRDTKGPPAHDDDVATKPEREANVDEIQSEQTAVECKVGTNARVIHCAPASDDRKSAEAGKPAENRETDTLVPASSTVESVETNIRVDAIAAITTPAPQSEHRQVPQLPEQAAPAAQIATQLRPLDPELVKDVVGKQPAVEKQGETDKKTSANEQLEAGQASDQPVEIPEGTVQASPAAHGSGKPQHATGDGDTRHVAQARGELPVSDRSHGDMPSSPADNLVSQRGLPDSSTPLMASTQTLAASNAAKAATVVSQLDLQPAAIRSPDLRSKSQARSSPARTGSKSASIRRSSGVSRCGSMSIVTAT